MKFYKTMAIRSGLYGCETWLMISKSILQATEMRFLKSVTGITRRYKITNYNIRNKLYVESLNGTVNKYRKRWKNHVQRMTENTVRRWSDYRRGLDR
jgi:hypothetical protein